MAKIILYYTFVEESDISDFSGSPQYYVPQGDVSGEVIEGNKILTSRDFDTASITEIKKQSNYDVEFTLIRHDNIVYPIVTKINNKIITPYTAQDSFPLVAEKGNGDITLISGSLYSTLQFGKYNVKLYNK
jgi:hypothetical protein